MPADARPPLLRSALLAAAAEGPRLKSRTLTEVYNGRPTWLKLEEISEVARLAAIADRLGTASTWAE